MHTFIQVVPFKDMNLRRPWDVESHGVIIHARLKVVHRLIILQLRWREVNMFSYVINSAHGRKQYGYCCSSIVGHVTGCS